MDTFITKFKKVAAVGVAMFLLGVILLSAISIFTGKRVSGASNEYTDSLNLMGIASKEAREALMKECKVKERVRLLYLLDANSGNTTPTHQEVLEVKQRLLENSCFFDKPVQQ